MLFFLFLIDIEEMSSTHSHAHECNDHGHSHEHNHHADHSTDNHDHSHGHATNHAAKSEAASEKERRHAVLKKLKSASLLCFIFLLVEVVGGILAGSLAVLSDAAHLAADLSAFVVAIVGSHIASLPASDAHTFGLKRTESLAALFSMTSLLVLSAGLAVEAVRRLWIILATPGENQNVDGKLMATIAFIGVVSINIQKSVPSFSFVQSILHHYFLFPHLIGGQYRVSICFGRRSCSYAWSRS